MAHPSSQEPLRKLKIALRDQHPQVSSSHLSEALAAGLGYKTNAALHAATLSEPLEVDWRVFSDRLRELGHSVEASAPLLGASEAPSASGFERRQIDTVLEAIPQGNGQRALEGPDEMRSGRPRVHVFLSYASEDRELAGRIATALNAAGVQTWWAEWEIRSGESIRQRIEVGLETCTHFIVLLTPTSIVKPWVNQEIDAGLVRHLAGQAQFIPLRSNLAATDMPGLLQGMLSPEVDPATCDIRQVVNDIYGIARRPPIGRIPEVVGIGAVATETGYSPAAATVAKLLVESSKLARKFDPQTSLRELAQQTGLTEEDTRDALYDLRGMVTLHREDLVYAEEALFVEFDRYWKDWNPQEDARTLAAEMMNDDTFPKAPAEIAARLDWPARRLNPALAYLDSGGHIRAARAFNGGPWLLAHVSRTDQTRRFVKSFR